MATDKKRQILLLPMLVLLLLLIAQPNVVYSAATRGLGLWWRMVAPALLPFFLVSELLLELGMARLLAPAFSRLMRPLFCLPGAAALPVLLGFCSGFPTGAILTSRLREQGALSAEAGARLVAFTNNAGPLYITVSVALGLLASPTAGWLLALGHYGGNLLIGIGLGLLARARGMLPPPDSGWQMPAESSAFSLGRALRKAAGNAANNILLIGCYMVFFSVVTALLDPPLARLNPLLHSLCQGFWEMTLGMDILVQSGLPLARILPMAAAILALGGVSVQAQVLAMIADTDISGKPYLVCRCLHALLAYGCTGLLCQGISLPAAAFGSLLPAPPPLLPLACYLAALALALLLFLGLALGHHFRF